MPPRPRAFVLFAALLAAIAACDRATAPASPSGGLASITVGAVPDSAIWSDTVLVRYSFALPCGLTTTVQVSRIGYHASRSSTGMPQRGTHDAE